MTTYTLPDNQPIGTMLYYNGDAVWFDGNTWQPIVTGSTKLDEAVDEISLDEATERADVAAIEADIEALQQQITDLQAQVAALQTDTSVATLEDRIYALEHRLNF